MSRRRFLVGSGVVTFGLAGTRSAAAAPAGDRLALSDVITPPSGTNYFGTEVVLSGDGRTAAILQTWWDWGSRRPGVVVATVNGPTSDSGWSRSAELDPGALVRGAALSYDGSVLAVTRSDPSPYGSVRVEVWERTGTQWRLQASWLMANTDEDVRQIVLSGDGTRMLVGARDGGNSRRAPLTAWRRSGASWVGERLPADLSADEGVRLALSADASTALVSAAAQPGAPQVLRYSADGWARAGTLPTPTAHADVWDALALSADGSVGAVGSERAETATVVRRGADGNYRITGRFGAGTPGDDHFGRSVALSGDGSALIVGAPWRTLGRITQAGGVYRYLWTGTGWRWGGLLDLGDPRVLDLVGQSIAMSADGATVLTSMPWRRAEQNPRFYDRGVVAVYRPR